MVEIDVNKLAKNQIQLESQNFKHQKILVVDDHQMILTGTLDVLKRQYPDTEFLQVKTARDALEKIAQMQVKQEDREQEKAPLNLIVVDLSIPASEGMNATTDTGIKLIEQLLKQYPEQNFLVQSSYVKALVRIKHEIDNHQGGFAIAKIKPNYQSK
ncbi:MAG: hypothetical protein RM368_24555 [Nostoc sp. DedSLP03]|nr:hypothetical protein [Nostoc sp. DedSLP03]MDZ7968084.1 hypothetical protein [Nostoc sp. DedSLP03]